ncbi:MAG: hypothetical protein QOF10_3858 [Kribbellaceae bacterium]|jgi:uncharacterized protein (DUF2267 family)|nr:hypothetical protein [Kribbellaceae bacterium]
MDYQKFVGIVQREAGRVSREVAELATQATFQTLAERLSRGQARDLVEQLPGSGPWLFPDGDSEPLRYDEFLLRVAKREGVDEATAERHARAVFAALGRAIDPDELADLIADLPQDFAPLVAEAQGRIDQRTPADELVRRVAERGHLHVDQAERAAEAVLETLAERLAPGEVDDLIARLDRDFHPVLERGKNAQTTATRRMDRMEFLQRVADRAGISPEEAFDQARAVFTTLRDALPGGEFWDIAAELPAEYAALWSAR